MDNEEYKNYLTESRNAIIAELENSEEKSPELCKALRNRLVKVCKQLIEINEGAQ